MRIGLALGSGAARGWAHLGVLRALAEGGIEPDVIAGTSVGALVGGAWLTDQVEPLSAWARSLGLMGLVPLLDLTLSRGGLLTVSKLFDRFRNPLTDVPIETLRRPFGVVATELSTGREVWLSPKEYELRTRRRGKRRGLSFDGERSPRWKAALLYGGLFVIALVMGLLLSR